MERKDLEEIVGITDRLHQIKVGDVPKILHGTKCDNHVLFIFVSHLRPMGLIMLGYQSHLLQRCHSVTVDACGHERSSRISPGLALYFSLIFFIAMQVQHSDKSSTNG